MRKFFILLLVSLFSLASPVHAEVDFSNKTITWVVPFKEGGGTSRFARFIQPFLTKYLPGNPDIQIMHIPGGGAIKGSNYFQKNAKSDGTFIFGCSINSSQICFGKMYPASLYNIAGVIISMPAT